MILISINIYGIGFDRKGTFSFGNGSGRSIIISGVDMISSPHIDNKKKGILTIGKGPTQGLEYTVTAEKLYSITFREHNKKFCLILRYNGANSYLFVNGTEMIKFKAKYSQIVTIPFLLETFKKTFPQIIWKILD